MLTHDDIASRHSMLNMLTISTSLKFQLQRRTAEITRLRPCDLQHPNARSATRLDFMVRSVAVLAAHRSVSLVATIIADFKGPRKMFLRKPMTAQRLAFMRAMDGTLLRRLPVLRIGVVAYQMATPAIDCDWRQRLRHGGDQSRSIAQHRTAIALKRSQPRTLGLPKTKAQCLYR
jgi:hypothetical protein